ncbi:MAG: hypothetical protein RMJ57_07320 [Bacteroidia bacterium]|nr:hypothetical protein [Bacteroidia bacterium]
MSYTRQEYEQLKEFYKRDLRERRAYLEALRHRRLRQKAEWHLQQMQASLRQLGLLEEGKPEIHDSPFSAGAGLEGENPSKTLL